MTAVLGINAFHPDASAALVTPHGLVAALEEERYVRVKHWSGLPVRAIGCCLREGLLDDLRQCESLAISRKPEAYLLRKALLAIRNPRSLRRAVRRVSNMRAIRGTRETLAHRLGIEQSMLPHIHSVEHHLAHIASAFFCSPFEEAACLTVDGFGDFVSTMLAVGRGGHIDVLNRVHFPHSLGLFYTGLTQYLGFPSYGDEYKLMGLAAYGEPTLVKKLRQVVPARRDGTFALDLSFFRHLREGVDMTWEDGRPQLGPVFTEKLVGLLGPARSRGSELSQRHRDLAASVQQVYEERLFSLVRALLRRTRLNRLCLAGGCGQNSLANGKLLENTDLRELFVQPAAADNGTSLGAALYVQHAVMKRPRSFVMRHGAWGQSFDAPQIRSALAGTIAGSEGRDGCWGEVEIRTMSCPDELSLDTARAIANGEVVGWFQGRAEWGPRALGHRSIVADPRRADMRQVLNHKIKRRESFRPFAPSVMSEHRSEWFEGSAGDAFMTQVAPVRPSRRAQIPAVTHADGTGRLQLVSRAEDPTYWSLISAFQKETGVPMLLNTSFNENEPIVNQPSEAIECFLRTRMDRVVLGDIVVRRRRESGAEDEAPAKSPIQ